MIDCLAEYLCNANINGCIHDDCENPMFSGIEERAFIFNKADIDVLSTDPDNSNIINNITLKSGATGYGIVNARNNPFTGTNTAVEVGDYRNTFTRTVSLFVPMDGAAAIRDIIDPLANGRFVIVMKNQFVNANGDNEYMIFGQDRGLKISSLTQTKYENNDYWLVELQETGVPTANKFFKYNGGGTTTYEPATEVVINGETFRTTDLSFGKIGSSFYLQYTAMDGGWVHGIEGIDPDELTSTVVVGGKTYRVTFGGSPSSWTDVDLNNFTIGDWVQPLTWELEVVEPTDSGEYLCSICNC